MDWWSAITAVGTVAMAATTVWIIRQNRDHHRDEFRPLCVLIPEDGVDPLDRGSLLTTIPSTHEAWHGQFSIHAALKNVGTGPATNIRLSIRCMGIQNYGATRELAPLAAGESRGSQDHPLIVPVLMNEKFNPTDFAMATGTAWEIILEYEDVFGRCFHTTHKKNPLDHWTICGVGRASAGFSPSVKNFSRC